MRSVVTVVANSCPPTQSVTIDDADSGLSGGSILILFFDVRGKDCSLSFFLSLLSSCPRQSSGLWSFKGHDARARVRARDEEKESEQRKACGWVSLFLSFESKKEKKEKKESLSESQRKSEADFDVKTFVVG